MAVRFQSVITRLGPRQIRLGSFYQTWANLTLKHMEVVDPSTKEIINGNYFTKIDFESVTPRDFAQTVNTLAQAVSAQILSRRTAIEELNKVAEDEEEYMREWNADPDLSPATAAAAAQAKGLIQQIAAGSVGAAAQGQQAGSDAAMPTALGENQHTQVTQAMPMRDTAAQLLGTGPSVTDNVNIRPPMQNA